jgi:hypothetical protein
MSAIIPYNKNESYSAMYCHNNTSYIGSNDKYFNPVNIGGRSYMGDKRTLNLTFKETKSDIYNHILKTFLYAIVAVLSLPLLFLLFVTLVRYKDILVLCSEIVFSYGAWILIANGIYQFYIHLQK